VPNAGFDVRLTIIAGTKRVPKTTNGLEQAIVTHRDVTPRAGDQDLARNETARVRNKHPKHLQVPLGEKHGLLLARELAPVQAQLECIEAIGLLLRRRVHARLSREITPVVRRRLKKP
jgi:hypothetical protein